MVTDVYKARIPVSLLNGLDDVLIGPVPVWALPVAHHFPHDDTKAPGVLTRYFHNYAASQIEDLAIYRKAKRIVMTRTGDRGRSHYVLAKMVKFPLQISRGVILKNTTPPPLYWLMSIGGENIKKKEK